MKRGTIWILLTVFLVISLLLVSCSASTTISTTTTKNVSQITTQPVTTTSAAHKTTSTTVSSTLSTSSTGSNWWDKLGKPQYGGTMTLRIDRNVANFDPCFTITLFAINSAWLERLWVDDWKLDPAVFSYNILFRANEYTKGSLAKSWEFTDPSTLTVHLRQGINWQNLPPANGREFIADDVVNSYNRKYGLGGGFTKPSPFLATDPAVGTLTSVNALDKQTVAFKWAIPNPEFIMETLQAVANDTQLIENPEAVKLWGDVNDWHHAIGTGPFILQDFVSGSSVTMVKNPNYWGYDERYPENKLPYIDVLKVLIIPDSSTALAGLRTGKIDAIDGISFQNAKTLNQTNPEILQLTYPLSQGITLEPRNDVVPFSDIKVRKALQMAIDLPAIAKSFYNGTTEPFPVALTSMYMKGFGFSYNQWPQDLKDEYAYNPTAAKKLLADAGYPTGFKTNVVADAAGDMDLLQIVKAYFADIGVNMDIRTMDSASWTTFVFTSRKHDQMAQRSTGQLGFTYEPIRQLQKYLPGFSSNDAMTNDPVYNAFYPNAMAATNMDDVKRIVKDANEYVARQHFVISLLQPNLFAFYQPWLKGYNGQTFAISGTAAGIQLLGFYPARFWIDTNLKSSSGH